MRLAREAGRVSVDALAEKLEVTPQTIRKDGPAPGRNDPCPCGSGQKYKKCCFPKFGE